MSDIIANIFKSILSSLHPLSMSCFKFTYACHVLILLKYIMFSGFLYNYNAACIFDCSLLHCTLFDISKSVHCIIYWGLSKLLDISRKLR